MICHKFVIRRKNEIVLIIDLWNTKLIFVAKFSARDNHEVFHPGERILDIRCTHGALCITGRVKTGSSSSPWPSTIRASSYLINRSHGKVITFILSGQIGWNNLRFERQPSS